MGDKNVNENKCSNEQPSLIFNIEYPVGQCSLVEKIVVLQLNNYKDLTSETNCNENICQE